MHNYNIDFYYKSKSEKQCLQPIFEELSKNHNCFWYSTLKNKRGQGDGAFATSHQYGNNQLTKEKDGYSFLFYLPHDLGKVNCYMNEDLREFDILFCPTLAHFKVASYIYKKYPITLQIPIPKLSAMNHTYPPKLRPGRKKIKDLPYPTTIIYAPSYTLTGEWRDVLKIAKNIPANFIFKSYPYFRDKSKTRVLSRINHFPYYRDDSVTESRLNHIDIFHTMSAKISDLIEKRLQT